MQIIGLFQIVTDVTSVVPTFLAALRFFDLLVLLFFFLFCFIRQNAQGDFAPAGATTGFALWIPTSL